MANRKMLAIHERTYLDFMALCKRLHVTADGGVDILLMAFDQLIILKKQRSASAGCITKMLDDDTILDEFAAMGNGRCGAGRPKGAKDLKPRRIRRKKLALVPA